MDLVSLDGRFRVLRELLREGREPSCEDVEEISFWLDELSGRLGDIPLYRYRTVISAAMRDEEGVAENSEVFLRSVQLSAECLADDERSQRWVASQSPETTSSGAVAFVAEMKTICCRS